MINIIKQIFGIDISMDTFEVRFGTTDFHQDQKISNSFTFNNTTSGFKKFIQWTQKNIISKEIPLFFVMEATGVYYENLAYFLFLNNFNVSVVLPNKIRNYARSLESKSKTDPIDAASITSFGLQRKLNPWTPPNNLVKSIKSLCREYHSIKTMITEVKNQLHAKNHSHLPDKQTIKRKTLLLGMLNKQTKQIEKEIHDIIQTDKELYEKVERLDKIKGLGFISVVTVIAETNCFELVANQKQLASYAGLDVVFNDSGIKKGKTSISKRGNKFLRTVVFMPALSACKHNHKMKELYIRLLSKGKNKKLALIAIARKLLLLIYTIWKNNTDYIPNYNPIISK
jgi:transposase